MVQFITFKTFGFVLLYSQKNKILGLKINKNYIDILLQVITGTSKIHAIGYPPLDKQLRIELSENAKIPYEAHMCFNQMIINTN